MNSDPISGKTMLWTFDDGPMAKKTIEHAFKEDGSLTFRMLDDKGEGKATRVEKYEVATVVLDSKTKKLVAFSSNDKGVSVQHGTFSEGKDQKRAQDPDTTEGNPSHAETAPAH